MFPLKSGILGSLLKNTEYDDLYKAAEKGDIPGMASVLEAYKKSVTVNGSPPKLIPLIGAAANNQVRVIQFLLGRKARIGLRNEKGMSALHAAAEKNNTDSVSVLLHAGIDPSAKDKLGRTALEIAREKKFYDTCLILETWPFIKRSMEQMAKLEESAKLRVRRHPDVRKFLAEYERRKSEIDREIFGPIPGSSSRGSSKRPMGSTSGQQLNARRKGSRDQLSNKEKVARRKVDSGDDDSSSSSA
ncbi:unnamed protein product [Notodromas monacha]|uniref:Uncharacterized protein n=1 Tax=Notodromas monacha TaxID=399045 RepID=A0A7R9BMV1_9CRUS|nr:unnamed protein product [Notodromas monacha]CAG0918093.1 unnamed protein product [Notodromas monacha]